MDTTLQSGSTPVGLAAGSAVLQGKVTKGTTFRQTDKLALVERFNTLLVILHVFSAVRTDETYDFYVTTQEGPAVWDIVHFAQVATTGEKIFVAKILLNGKPEIVTNVTTTTEHSLTVLTGAANAIESIAADSVRHGPIGRRLGHSVVIAGSAPSVVYEILIRGE